MAIFDLYSKRQKQIAGGCKDVFSYDPIPKKLRVQIAKLWEEAFGKGESIGYQKAQQNPPYEWLHDVMAKELGRFTLDDDRNADKATAFLRFFVDTATTTEALDAIELSFVFMQYFHTQPRWKQTFEPSSEIEEAIADINQRFSEHCLGYSVVNGPRPEIIRQDN